jgi:hypothetical protein
LVLLALADCCNQDRAEPTCWPSVAWLCQQTLLQRRTLLRAMDELEAANLIVRTSGNGRRTTRYHLQIDAEEAKPNAIPSVLKIALAVPNTTTGGVSRDTSEVSPVTPLAVGGVSHDTSEVSPPTPLRCRPSHLRGVTPDTSEVSGVTPGTRREPEVNQKGTGGAEREGTPDRDRSLSDPPALDWQGIARAERPDLVDHAAVWRKFEAFHVNADPADHERLWRLWLLREREPHPECRRRIDGADRVQAPGTFLASTTALSAAYEVILEP